MEHVAEVITALVEQAAVDPETLMLLGADCRNAWHAELGYTSKLRSTTDVDFAVLLGDWEAYKRVRSVFQSVGSNDIRVRILGHAVDILPFGSVENPSGIAHPKQRDHGLNVFGFSSVFANSIRADIDGAPSMRLPTPAGYATLKILAWIDRSVYGQYKDASDLAVVMSWYAEATEVAEYLRDTDEGNALLEAHSFFPDRAAAEILGQDIVRLLGVDHTKNLASRWATVDPDELAGELNHPSGYGWPAQQKDRLELVLALMSPIVGPQD